jgi:hypothetical protein
LLAWGEVTNENEQGEGLATRGSASLDEKVRHPYYRLKIYFHESAFFFRTFALSVNAHARIAETVPSLFTVLAFTSERMFR